MNHSRSNIRYDIISNHEITEAYNDGFYDGVLSILSESAFKITGICESQKSAEAFLDNMSFGGTISLVENKGHNKDIEPFYTQLLLATPRDDRREKLAKVVTKFLNTHFPDHYYSSGEHTDTDILHYHVLVQKRVAEGELIQLRSEFIELCLQNDIRLI